MYEVYQSMAYFILYPYLYNAISLSLYGIYNVDDNWGQFFVLVFAQTIKQRKKVF